MKVGKVTGTLTLTSKPKQIARAGARQFLKALNQRIRQRLPRLVEAIRERVKQAIMESPEVEILQQDKDLQGQMGFVDVTERFEAIAEAVSESVFPIFRPFRSVNGKRVSGRLDIFASPKDNAKLYTLAEAYVGGENAALFLWLKALLEAGDEILITGYQYSSRILSPETLARVSRTGQGIMLKRNGKGWRVPPEISGTEESNLLTRALTSPDMQSFIQRQFVKLLTG